MRTARPTVRISIHAPREGSDSYHGDGVRVKGPFQSTLPARGATVRDTSPTSLAIISIHAPREGSDVPALGLLSSFCISIHAPREGSDHMHNLDFLHTANFNPRSPRGERPSAPPTPRAPEDFNPRSPRGERRSRDSAPSRGLRISIHAPREGSDSAMPEIRTPAGHFNPRSPRGERRISDVLHLRTAHFNPRSPRGERHP